MKIDKGQLQKFRETFHEEYKVKLTEEEVEDSLENLVNFFDLLIQFDQDDKRKQREKTKKTVVNTQTPK